MAHLVTEHTGMALTRRTLLTAAALAAPHVGAPRLAGAQPSSVLRFVPQADLTVLDPVWTTATVTATHGLMVFDTLYGLDKDYAPAPQMVEGHLVEDGGRTWTMTLRPGLRFHDGEPVRGRDAVASIRRWAARDMFGQEVLAVSDEITAPDDRTIRFRLKQPFPLLQLALGKVTPSMCAIMPERLAVTDPGKQVTEMVGSGPFRFLASERVAGARVAYARFENYVPRPSGQPSRTTGPKLAHFDRIEWTVIPDQATAAAALQAGEVDWLDTTSADLMPLFRRNSKLVAAYSDERNNNILRFNSTIPPFDNPAIRRALLAAVSQRDVMTTAFGDDPKAWKVDVGFFLSDGLMASDAGLDTLTGKRDLARVKHDLGAAGYKGERVVVLQPEDFPSLKAMTEVSADMLRKAGMLVDVVSADWGTVVQRRASREPAERGGWNVFVAGTTTTLDPSGHLGLRGNGSKAWFGWPDNPRLEALRQQWLQAPDLAQQRAICRDMQLEAFQSVPYIPLGESSRLSAYRGELSGFPVGQIAFYGVRRG